VVGFDRSFECSCVLPAFQDVARRPSLKLHIHHVSVYRQALATPTYRPWTRRKEQIKFSEDARISNAKFRPAVPDTENNTISAYCPSLEGADNGSRRIEPNRLPPVLLKSGKSYRSRSVIIRTNETISVMSCRVVMHGRFPPSAHARNPTDLSDC
jgi:hypothetical protein